MNPAATSAAQISGQFRHRTDDVGARRARPASRPAPAGSSPRVRRQPQRNVTAWGSAGSAGRPAASSRAATSGPRRVRQPHSPVRSVDLGLDADLEPAQRGGQRLAPADLAVEPGGVADPQEAQVGVELALGLEEQGMGALPVGQAVEVLGQQALEELEGVGPVDEDRAPGAAVDEGGAVA